MLQEFYRQKKKEKPFSEKQRAELAILHEEIDEYMNDFHNSMKKCCLKEEIRGLLKELDVSRDTTVKRLYMLKDTDELVSLYEKMEYFKKRAMRITRGKPVKSITNKLLTVVPNIEDVRYYVIRRFIANSSRQISLKSLQQQIADLEESLEYLNNKVREDRLEEISACRDALSFAKEHNLEFLQMRVETNNIKLYTYDKNGYKTISDTGLSFLQGVVLPKGAKKGFDPSVLRIEDKIKFNLQNQEHRLYIKKRYYFIINPEHYTKNKNYFNKKRK